MKIKQIIVIVTAVLMCGAAFAAGTVSDVKARQRYPWNGKVDIDCTLSGTAGTSYALTVNARDKVGCTNLAVKTVSVEGGSATGNPVSVTPGTYRLVWDAGTDLPNGFRGEKISISVSVSESAAEKKFMIVDLASGAITYQATAPSGGWNVDAYKGTKMAFVRIEPGTFTQYSVSGMPGREVTITKPYYIGILPVTHKQMRTLVGASYASQNFNDSYDYFSPANYYVSGSGDVRMYYGCNGYIPYKGGNAKTDYCLDDVTAESFSQYCWPAMGYSVSNGSPLSVLRQRSGHEKFYLPTEAQVTFARDAVIWDGYTMCLDLWNPWLGTLGIKDPLGEFMGMGTLTFQGYPKFHYCGSFSCVSKTDRKSMKSLSTCPTRFCLYEVD